MNDQNQSNIEYKDTLNLPNTTLAMRANAAVREVEIQKFWDENEVYWKNVNQRDKNNKFVLHDGPPYLSSPKIHIGTALNKILKDILVKYKSQAGFFAPMVPGYDGHGLPIENAVVKSIKGGRSALTPYELRQKCREYAKESLKGQETEFRRLGAWGDWEHPYLTIVPEYEAEQIRVFGELFKKGYIEKGMKPVYWCTDCETALAEAEVEYAEHTSDAIYVRFQFDAESKEKAFACAGIKSDKDLYAVIWTTTPWTIPSNLAIALNPRLTYTFFEHKGDIYFAAQELLRAFLQDIGWEESDIKVVGACKGINLEHLITKHPLYDRASAIILGEHVTTEAGTGAVHTAPGHGSEDFVVGMKYGLEVLSPIDAKGFWTEEGGKLQGVPYYKGNAIIIEDLKNCGALLASSDIAHSYPHCWRCKHPVMYRATPQWFIKVDKFRQEALDAIKTVEWIPAGGETRISNMVAGRTDWCLSRQRAWGVPIPVFYCKDCNEIIVTDETISNVASIFEKESSDAWVKYSTEELLPAGFKCSKCGGSNFSKENDIMDVWLDSGISWRAVVEARSDELGNVPVEMYLEGSDQHRGWFQSSLLTSVALEGKAPFKTVLTHGFVMAGDGKKMSKSLGNFITPGEVISKYGADVLRLWGASIDYRNDVRISETIISHLVEVFKKTRNTARFLLGNLFDFDPAVDYVKYEDLKAIDKFALDKLNNLIENVTEAFDNYEFYKYFQHLQNFAAIDLSSFYLDIVKDRLYTSGKKSVSRRACQTVMYEILQALVRLLVPVMPHQAEDIWQNTPECQRNGLMSILLSDWPKVNPEWKNAKLEEEFPKILKAREVVTRAIEPLRADKKVGSSLEVAVYVSVPDNEILKTNEEELCNIFITSQAYVTDEKPENILNEYKEENYTVWVTEAKGEKCERCWKYRKLGYNMEHSTICPACFEAIK